MNNIIYILIIIFTVGCVPPILKLPVPFPPYEFGSTVKLTDQRVMEKDPTNPNSTLIHHSARIRYKSPQFISKEIYGKSQLEMWSEDKLNDELRIESAYEGGYIIAHTADITIGGADEEYWDCIIQKMNGDAVNYRRPKSDFSVPNHRSLYDIWYDIFIVYIYEPMEEPFKVFLIDRLSQRRNEYIVYPNEKITDE